MVWCLWGAALAAAPDPAASAAQTAYWAGSRWLLSIEETTPSPVELSAEENVSFRTRALQIEAVMSCPTATPAGKQLDVTCHLDQVVVRATPRTLSRVEALNPGNQRVMDSIAARLKGQELLVRTTVDGRLLTVDLPALVATTRRESESREVLRRLVFDLLAGFHLRHPEDWQSGWQEKNTALLRAPTQPGSSGLSIVKHGVSQVQGLTVVQSEGKGTFTSPYEPWEFGYEGRINERGANSGDIGSSAPSAGQTPTVSQSTPTPIDDGRFTSAGPSAAGSTPTDYTFTGTLSSIAVLDPASGLPLERKWATLGRPNASSIGNMQGTSVYYAGNLRKLGPDEQPQLGKTEVVAPPGQSLQGIGIWVPLATI